MSSRASAKREPRDLTAGCGPFARFFGPGRPTAPAAQNDEFFDTPLLDPMDFAQEGYLFACAFMGGNCTQDNANKNEDCKKGRDNEERENKANHCENKEHERLIEM